MQITDENPQEWQKNWAVNLKAMRLSDADRAYDKTGMHLVMVGQIDGKEVPIAYHLTKLDAINLSLILTAEVSREMTLWPNGYSDEEREVWHAAIQARQDAELDAQDAQICRLHDEDPAGWAAYRATKSDVQRTALDAAMKARAERLGLPPSQGEGAGE